MEIIPTWIFLSPIQNYPAQRLIYGLLTELYFSTNENYGIYPNKISYFCGLKSVKNMPERGAKEIMTDWASIYADSLPYFNQMW